jgi:hypothetical protein
MLAQKSFFEQNAFVSADIEVSIKEDSLGTPTES